MTRKWLSEQFKDVRTSFASGMAIVGALGVLSCAAIIGIVLLH